VEGFSIIIGGSWKLPSRFRVIRHLFSIISISIGSSSTTNSIIASITAFNTTLVASGACVFALFTKLIRTKIRIGEATFDSVTVLFNGALVGMVSITAGYPVVEPWSALITGIIAGWIYLCISNLLIKFCLDDAVDAIPVHLANG